MIDNLILESIQEFLKEHVAPAFRLQVPNDDDYTIYQLQHPNVFIGWLPLPNQLQDVPQQLPDGLKSAIPAMIVGMDEGDDDGSEAGIGIRINFVVFNAGFYPKEGEMLPDFKGYRDLLNLIYRARQELARACVMPGGSTSVQRPFRWGMYPEQPSQYWVGYLTFRATATSLPYIPDYILE
ncbi:hypothetical protein [Gorillibacterium sp. sgz5001074]|uniref:hypothetical protein n=1 Tax=Gorillibacterium sp. sgz5001074 TaxID=3446695 RepID=UPI003F6687C9